MADEKRHEVRRENDREHCDMHTHNTETLDRNTNDLSGLKSAFRVLVWVLTISIPIGCSIIGYFVMQMDHTMDKLADNMAAVNGTVQQAQVLAAENYTKLDMLQSDVQELKGKK